MLRVTGLQHQHLANAYVCSVRHVAAHQGVLPSRAAAFCAMLQVYKALQAAGADASLTDKEGSTAAEQAPAAWSS
jgi:hypothetical protein